MYRFFYIDRAKSVDRPIGIRFFIPIIEYSFLHLSITCDFCQKKNFEFWNTRNLIWKSSYQL